MIDLIQVIPYPLFLDFTSSKAVGDSSYKYLYLIRLYRLFNGLSVMNIRNMMYQINKYYKQKIQAIIDYDPALANEKNQEDNNYIEL